MSAMKLIKPAEGRRVRHPDGRLLDDAGEVLEMTAYWQRRLNDEDVSVSNPPKAPKES